MSFCQVWPFCFHRRSNSQNSVPGIHPPAPAVPLPWQRSPVAHTQIPTKACQCITNIYKCYCRLQAVPVVAVPVQCQNLCSKKRDREEQSAGAVRNKFRTVHAGWALRFGMHAAKPLPITGFISVAFDSLQVHTIVAFAHRHPLIDFTCQTSPIVVRMKTIPIFVSTALVKKPGPVHLPLNVV